MMRIAIIGAGISGGLTARLLSTQHDVTLFEAGAQPGGHANTVDVTAYGRRIAVDTGFMVFNQRTYPNFCRLLELLGAASQPSDMSFSVRCSQTGLQYQGSSLNGLFGQRSNLVRPAFLRMLRDIVWFNRLATSALTCGELQDGRTVGEFLNACNVGKLFIHQYLTPMAAAIWSCDPRAILEFPAKFLLGFFANHGLLQLRDRPQWRTIVGGSRSYVQALLTPIANRVFLRQPVEAVRRSDGGVLVQLADSPPERFDQVVFATHADQALRLLADATPRERRILGAFPYQTNEAVLHTDTSILPSRRRMWASWNYHLPRNAAAAASVTYDLSRLQQHDTPGPVLLTLNESSSIDPTKVVRTFTYRHPAYQQESIDAQRRWEEISGRGGTHFCGAYWGYGFHEDGVNSALAVAKRFGIGLQACTVAPMKERSRIAAASR